MITVEWANAEKTIIQFDYYAPVVSWDEYDEANLRALEMVKTVTHPVYLIHNPGGVAMPQGSPIPHLRKAILRFQQTPNCALVIAVVENLFALNMVSMVTRMLFPKKFRLVGTLQDAYGLIPAIAKAC